MAALDDPENVNTEELGDLGLTPEEVDAIAAFMETLTDGFMPVDEVVSNEEPEGEFQTASSVATSFGLEQNYPNPFNPTTTLSFSLPAASYMTLTVYDVNGREVALLTDGFRAAGLHEVTFDASNLSSGIYIYRLSAGDFSAIGKMVLMK